MDHRLLSSVDKARILVVGDLMLDHYVMGEATRISPEAPIPVVLVDKDLYTPGGAANVAANVASLGAGCRLMGVVGKDDSGDRLRSMLKYRYRVNVADVVHDLSEPLRPTTTKTRIVAGTQQIVRYDREICRRVHDDIKVSFSKKMKKMMLLKQIDAVIIEDYAKGMLSQVFVQGIIDKCKEHGVVVVMDPNPRNPIRVDGLTTMTPNRHEAYGLVGWEEKHGSPPPAPLEDQSLHEIGQHLLIRYGLEFLIVTLGKDGLIIYSKDGSPPFHMPTRAVEVFDVSGAGDTFISVFTTYYAMLKDVKLCAEIANVAAGIVVGKRGAATVTVQEILERMS